MNLLLQHLLLEMSALLFGILGGSFVVWFCAEELSLYRDKIRFSFIMFSFLMLLAPVLYSIFFGFKNVFPFLTLFAVYTALFLRFQNKEDRVQAFFYIAALVLFLASSALQLFFLALALFLLTVLCFVLLYEKNKISFLHFFGEQFSGFFVLTLALYGLTWIFGLF